MQVRADTRLCLYGFRLRHWGGHLGWSEDPVGISLRMTRTKFDAGGGQVTKSSILRDAVKELPTTQVDFIVHYRR